MTSRIRRGIFLVFCLTSANCLAQIQPLSRQDLAEIKNYTQTYTQALSNKDDKTAADNLNKIAYIHWNHNDYRKAIEFYEKSLAHNEKVENENGIAMICNNLGMLYSDVKEYEKSIDFFNRTLAGRRAKKQKAGIISALINISVVTNNLGRYNESVNSLDEALTLAREMSDIDQMRSCYGMLAETYQKSGNPEKSLYYFNYYRSFHELSQKEKIKDITVNLDEERKEKALLEKEKALISGKLQNKRHEIDALSYILKSADSTLNTLNVELGEKNLQLELVEKDREILKLKAEQEMQNAEKQSQKTKWIALITTLIILFLVALILLILRNRRRIAEKNTLLEERYSEILAINTKLSDANRVKDTLFSIIAHDLKSPLAQLEQTFLLIEENLIDPEELDFFIQELQKRFKNTNFLLENLLAWAKNQMSGATVSFKRFVLNNAIEECLQVLESLYTEKKIRISKSLEFEASVHADEDMIKLIVRNILANAIKFTPKEGEIKIKTWKIDQRNVGIKIADSGIGMSQKQIAQLFSGNTTSTYGTEKEKGTGIGLKLSKQFIDLMNGNIRVSSTKGEGSTFSIELPIQQNRENLNTKLHT